MKTNPVRFLLAAITCLVLQTGTTRAVGEEVAKPESVTYLITLKRTLLSGEVVSESTTYSSSEGGEFSGTIPVDLKEGSRPPLLVAFDVNEATANFEVMDPSMMRQGMSEGRSFSYPITILETTIRRKNSDVYTLLGTEAQKLTISFKKLDPKELDEVPEVEEADGKK